MIIIIIIIIIITITILIVIISHGILLTITNGTNSNTSKARTLRGGGRVLLTEIALPRIARKGNCLSNFDERISSK